MQGEIKKLVSDRGFGFIQTEDGKDVFFHGSGLVEGNFDQLQVGQQVTFDMGSGPKGPRAENVRVLS